MNLTRLFLISGMLQILDLVSLAGLTSWFLACPSILCQLFAQDWPSLCWCVFNDDKFDSINTLQDTVLQHLCLFFLSFNKLLPLYLIQLTVTWFWIADIAKFLSISVTHVWFDFFWTCCLREQLWWNIFETWSRKRVVWNIVRCNRRILKVVDASTCHPKK